MQTLSVPYRIREQDKEALDRVRRVYSSAVRQAYKASVPREKGEVPSEKEVRARVNDRHRASGLGAWLLQCSVLEGRQLARAHPDGKVIFGGAKSFERRGKGLLSNEEWKRKRLMPLFSQGEVSQGGNRVLRFSQDGQTATLRLAARLAVEGEQEDKAQVGSRTRPVETILSFDLVPLRGLQGRLFGQVSTLARASDITLSVRIDDTYIHLTFDELDLRKLPQGKSLSQAKMEDVLAGKAKRKGRARGENYQPPKVKPLTCRPVHPQWKDPIPGQPSRRLGIDLNPEWIGLSVIENQGDPSNLDDIRLLDYQLIHFDPRNTALSSRQALRLAVADAATRAVAMARAWHVPECVLEKGLGYLRSSTNNPSLNHRNNRWPRTWFHQALLRRARLSGLEVRFVPGAYSTTIGNLAFQAPDACASAAEIGRRGLLELRTRPTGRTVQKVSAGASKDAPGSAPATVSTSPAGAKTVDLKETTSASTSPPLSPFLKALLPRFSPHHLPDQWKKMTGEATTWVEVHGIIKTTAAASPKALRVGLRRPHLGGFFPGSLGLPEHCRPPKDPMPFLHGHEVGRLGWLSRPGWVLRPHPSVLYVARSATRKWVDDCVNRT